MGGLNLVSMTLSVTGVPAKKVPNGMWFDVLAVLKAHGLDPAPGDVVQMLVALVRHTPVEQGGRLEPDGHIEQEDTPDLIESWYCTECHRERFEPEHDDCFMRRIR